MAKSAYVLWLVSKRCTLIFGHTHTHQLSENLGTVLISLSYSPDTRKLSVIILRAKDLNRGIAKETGVFSNHFVCVILFCLEMFMRAAVCFVGTTDST